MKTALLQCKFNDNYKSNDSILSEIEHLFIDGEYEVFFSDNNEEIYNFLLGKRLFLKPDSVHSDYFMIVFDYNQYKRNYLFNKISKK